MCEIVEASFQLVLAILKLQDLLIRQRTWVPFGRQMDPYGILVVFNFSHVQINAPASWLHDRYLVVVINLQRKAPSGRDRCIEVSEAGAKGIGINDLTVPRKSGYA